MWRGVAGLVFFLLALLWSPGAADAGQVYVVRQGDTLWRISHHLGVRPADLATANHLALSTTIHPGQRLTVPGRSVGMPAGIVRTAMEFLGRPYQWAGMGTHGFDCSGLISRVFAAFGRPLPHSSYRQYQAGRPVSRWELAPGDLVFFHTDRPGPSHVGIYVGDSRFIHASYSRGVMISSVDEPYFRDRYLGARRIQHV